MDWEIEKEETMSLKSKEFLCGSIGNDRGMNVYPVMQVC